MKKYIIIKSNYDKSYNSPELVATFNKEMDARKFYADLDEKLRLKAEQDANDTNDRMLNNRVGELQSRTELENVDVSILELIAKSEIGHVRADLLYDPRFYWGRHTTIEEFTSGVADNYTDGRYVKDEIMRHKVTSNTKLLAFDQEHKRGEWYYTIVID